MLTKANVPIISISFASILAICKLVVAIYSGSLAVFSSALDSLLDILSSMVNYFALKTAETPPDENHPFGHGKFEALAAFVQSIIIFLTGAYLLWRSFQNFVNKVEISDVNASIFIMVFSVIMTMILSIILRYYAKKFNSNVILTDSMHYEIDLVTNLGVLFSLLFAKYFEFHSIDYIVSSIISIYIMVSSSRLALSVSRELLDAEISSEELERIKDILKGYGELLIDYHKIRTRRAGKTIFLDMHITICREMNLSDAHKIADSIENDLTSKIENIDVIIHIDPCDQRKCPGILDCDRLESNSKN
ncbi:MAG: cation diffusion facilitator family transporter [Calditerrivibrio sp.]|nr:cation diffusion facilitator family transporter [Calditerrivibrio sp.]MCA1932605.1 cation diffusion facilitator family transporter [Calditerrivibrio sp.]MCA1980308.1 cation diffusion facilitator family transporter [Calditerrivibrio sp.]